VDVRFNSLPSSRNPLVQAFSLVLGTVLLVGAALLGAFIFAIALGIGVVFAAVLILRMWWMRRRIAAAHKSGSAPFTSASSGSAARGRVIDVEYTVVDGKSNESDDSSSPR
jgi:uncharacterized iron-regulated membrane protein